jgi:predicted HicB family RNase H-like nuclease
VPRLHIELPDSLHRRAKIAAVQRGVTLKAFVIEALERLVIDQEAEDARGRSTT